MEQNSTVEAKPTRKARKTRVGVVTSIKMQKSISVELDRKVMHPKYGKFLHKTAKYMAHDEKNESRVGDTVRIMETRKLSKNKSWRLIEIIARAK